MAHPIPPAFVLPVDHVSARALCATLILSIVPAIVAGQASPLPLPRLDGPITVDGHVDEAVWDLLVPIEVTQKVPIEGAPPSQRTEIRIGYDANYLYLSGRLFDEEPAKIIANTKKRDDFTENTEWVGLLIDTYDDRENALGFFVTPTGARLDMAIANDAQGAQGINVNWNAFWDASARRDETGWFAEIRIPFSSLPFSADDGDVVMGITTWRYIARNDETSAYPPRGLSTGSSFRPSLTQRFSMAGIESAAALAIVPYALTGRSDVWASPQPGSPALATDTYEREVGLDARLRIGGSTNIDVTLNTDFAQVEVDDQQVNLTRSSLFFPEKRLFFQERASLFDFSFGPTDRAFHSRRIGLAGSQRTRILGGVRAVGKAGDFEGGLLSMQTQGRASASGENLSVLRLKRRVLNENSTIGVIGTSRTDLAGAYNALYGADATLRVQAEHFLSLRWAQSFSGVDPAETTAMDRARLFIEMADRSPLGFTYGASWSRSGAAFDPGIGFQSRADLSRLDYTAGYNVFPAEGSPWVQYGPFISGSSIWGNSGRGLESRSNQLGLHAFAKSGWGGSVLGQEDVEVVADPLALGGGLEIAPGRYTFRTLGGSVTSPSSLRLSGSTGFSVGGFYDGQIKSVSVAPIITVTPDLSVTMNYWWNRIERAGTVTTVRLSSAKVDYFFSTTLSISALLQHNSTANLFVGSARLRFNPREGEDLYVVINGDANTARDRFVPELPLQNQRTIQVKYSRAFRPFS